MTDPTPDADAKPLVAAFPRPGLLVANAYRELHIAATGTEAERAPLGNPRLLPRPWDPASCTSPQLRAQVWAWLDEVVAWLNVEYAWDVADVIPGCWPHHPHLVHEIAILADRRRRAGLALDGDLLDEWHRTSLPSFIDRMRSRLKNHCDERHQTWPARSRHTRYHSADSASDRTTAFTGDAQAADQQRQLTRPRLALVDLDTGEIIDDFD